MNYGGSYPLYTSHKISIVCKVEVYDEFSTFDSCHCYSFML